MKSAPKKSKSHIFWARIDPETPWNEWWPSICEAQGWPKDIQTEKWSGTSDFSWARVLDSAKTFSLFAKFKAIIVADADKALKGEKDLPALVASLSQGPHKVIFQSSQACPKTLAIDSWEAPQNAHSSFDEKIAFRWIEALHLGKLSDALAALEGALSQDQHPFALLQLVARDFRLGRLIQHAIAQRIREEEMLRALRVNPYAIKKWGSRKVLRKSQWMSIFERLLVADLELKSGNEETWVLRKLTFDLIEMMSGADRKTRRSLPLRLEPKLWTALPSFA